MSPRLVTFDFESIAREILREHRFGELPRRACVFRVFDRNGNLILLEKTHNLPLRLEHFYSESPKPGAIDLRDISDRLEYCTTDSAFESSYLLYLERRRWFPASYRRMKTFPLYQLIELDSGHRFPRIDTGREIQHGRRYFGPFRTRRDAERARTTAEKTFRIRPCDYDIRGDDPYPDCLYFQMETCSRPCNGDISPLDYCRDVEDAVALIEGHDEASLVPLGRRIETLANEMRYEEAEQLRLQIERATRGRSEMQHRIFEVDRFDFVVLLKAESRRNRKLALIRSGRILRIEEHSTETLEDTLARSLAAREVQHPPAAEDLSFVYDEFCLSASFLLRPLRSVPFFPLGDPGHTAAAVVTHIRDTRRRTARGGQAGEPAASSDQSED